MCSSSSKLTNSRRYVNVTTVNNDTGAATVSVGTVADADAFIATLMLKL